MLQDKIREEFRDMVVLKSPTRSKYFSDLSLPSYMRDWLIMRHADEEGEIDADLVARFIKQYLPTREAFEQIKFDIVHGTQRKFLARSRIDVDVRTGKTRFELPDLGGRRAGAAGFVLDDVVRNMEGKLLKESENWGIITLGWTCNDKGEGYVYMDDYESFCPYEVDLEFYKNARRAFTIEEWIDVLVTAVDYNPVGYDSQEQKLVFLRRLLPFVEKRVNILELAPKGTGKSYVYNKISKRGWLVSGGTVSRASLIYDNQKKTGGLITRFDFVGFDEIQSMTFVNESQIQTALKDYMEFGETKGYDASVVADAGIVVLGNVDASKFSFDRNITSDISSVFHESASLDRFHGFIPGWEIPRMRRELVADGWALNTEYFAEIMHYMRDELYFASIVDECLEVPPKADQRDLTAIKRLCCAFLKLLFPHVETRFDISKEEFVKYCLEPAKEMRAAVKKQLCIVDPKEFDVDGKRNIPDIQYKD